MGGHASGKPIARGRTAEIYAWDEQHVLKLFNAGRSSADVEYEARVAHAVHASGFPMPAARAIVEQDGRFGIIYERVEGSSLLRMLSSRPQRILYAARLLARLHVSLHEYRITDLPSLHSRLATRLTRVPFLSEATRRRLQVYLETLPEGDRLCHGDFHPDNVLLTAKGPVIIDWNDATRGVPAADVARSTILMRDSVLPPEIPMRRRLELFRGLFLRLYRLHYLRLRPDVVHEAARWEPIVAAVRLNEDVNKAEADRLIRLAKSVRA